MNKIMLFALLLFGSLGPVRAQSQEDRSEKKNGLQFLAGYNTGYFKDLVFSPLNYEERGLLFSLAYFRRKPAGKSIFHLGLDASPSRLKTPVANYLATAHYLVNIELGYLRQWKTTEKYRLFAGAQYRTNFNFASFKGAESITFLATHGLEGAVYGEYKIGDKHRISSKLTLPLLFLFVRPPYSGWDKYVVEHENNPVPVFFNGEITSLQDFFSIAWDNEYRYHVWPWLDLLVQYRFYYQQTKQPDLMKSLRNQLQVGITIKY